MEVNIADVIARVNELQSVDVDTMQKAISEIGKPVNFPLFIFFFSVMKNGESIYIDEAKEYALNTISVLEEATGDSYTENEKEVLCECFAIAKCGKEYGVKERISDIEALSERYKDEEPGTFVWVVLGLLKRELLRLYSLNHDYIGKMKELIAELKSSNELYKKCTEKELM